MRLLGLDIETTGLDAAKDHITEIAWVVKDHDKPKPLSIHSHFVNLPHGVAITDEIRDLTKITPEHLAGRPDLEDIFRWLVDDILLYKVGAVVAHNGENFDKPFLSHHTRNDQPEYRDVVFNSTPWIDTSVDCVYPPACRQTNLLYVAAFMGFLNPFPHAALFDVMTMLKVLDQFPLTPVMERAKSPWCVVKACVSYEQRMLAKARRYGWESAGGVTYPKTWVKKIKELDFAKEVAEAPFQVGRVE